MKRDSLYNLWFWFGCKFRFFYRYNKKRDKSLLDARDALELALTPQLQKMLSDWNNENE